MNKSLDEVVNQINLRRSQIETHKLWQNGELLSRMVVELAVLNSYLGEQIPPAELDMNTAETNYKYIRDKALRDTEGALNRAEVQVLTSPEYQDALEQFNNAKYNHRLISLKRLDTNNLIDAIRSRLSFMKADKI